MPLFCSTWQNPGSFLGRGVCQRGCNKAMALQLLFLLASFLIFVTVPLMHAPTNTLGSIAPTKPKACRRRARSSATTTGLTLRLLGFLPVWAYLPRTQSAAPVYSSAASSLPSPFKCTASPPAVCRVLSLSPSFLFMSSAFQAALCVSRWCPYQIVLNILLHSGSF